MSMPMDIIRASIIPVTAISIIAITIIIDIIIDIIPIPIDIAVNINIIPIIGKRFVITIGHMAGTINILIDMGIFVKMGKNHPGY